MLKEVITSITMCLYSQPLVYETYTIHQPPIHMIRQSKFQFQRPSDRSSDYSESKGDETNRVHNEISIEINQSFAESTNVEVSPYDRGSGECSDDVCLICMEQPFNTVLIECGHRCWLKTEQIPAV
jgi:hypothetical protein